MALKITPGPMVGPQYDAGHAVDGGLHQQHAGIEKLMRKLTQDQLKEFIAYLKALEASAGQQ